MRLIKQILSVLPLVATILGQTCENYGTPNGSGCLCPTGFGGTNCSLPACGGDIFQGSQRPLASIPSGSSFANLTAGGCSCESGWIGTGCSVCQSPSACQSAFVASGKAPSSAQSVSSTQDGQNNTLTCNKSARVWAAGQMSCQVNNPTLQALYPLTTTLNILRTLQPDLTPIPNTTAFGTAGSAYAHIFYAGVEQFYCHADSCVQDVNTDGTGSARWTCQNLQCTCRPGTTFCGAIRASDLTGAINGLTGTLTVQCQPPDNSTGMARCNFKQSTLQSLFGPDGLGLDGCTFGECVSQSVIDNGGNATSSNSNTTTKPLSGGVIAGLAVVGGLVLFALCLLALGLVKQRAARKSGPASIGSGGIAVEWRDVSYTIPTARGTGSIFGAFYAAYRRALHGVRGYNDDKVILDSVNGRVLPGQMMAILGPSGAGKTTLVDILAGKNKSGVVSGNVAFPPASPNAHTQGRPRIGFVPQQDVLPPTLTVFEALLFAARLRLPESLPDWEKQQRVDQILAKLGIEHIRDSRIGYGGESGGGKARGISGGETRRVSIGLELIASPDVLILDEPTSGLDSVSASRVANALHAIAHDPEHPTAVIASIHQPSSKLYQTFDSILLLSHGRALYSGPGSFAPAEHFATMASGIVEPYQQGYNVADYLLEIASDPPAALFQVPHPQATQRSSSLEDENTMQATLVKEKAHSSDALQLPINGIPTIAQAQAQPRGWRRLLVRSEYAATFLTQLQVLSGREWKILQRDYTLFFTHVAVSAVLGVFCGGLYFQTGFNIAGFQSRVGCLFFLGALIAFSSLSALYNVVETRSLFLRERSSSYYSPSAWLLSRFLFDVVPLRIIPTIIVSTITYWMAGLAHDAQHFFKFLFILVLFTLAMTLFNFLLGTLFQNGGIAILLSALSALYQMTFAGFFVHLQDIPPVLRWLQWLCPLKYTLEALSVNEVGSGLMIQDTLEGVPVNVSASLIMQLLFGFGVNNYYRDVLVLFAFIAGFGLGVIGVVWFKVREKR